MGFSGRLRLLCEVPGPGKAAKWSEGGGVVAAPPGFNLCTVHCALLYQLSASNITENVYYAL